MAKKILYASLCGSKGKGISRPDSDTDIRYIYCYNPEEYYALDSWNYPTSETSNKMNIDQAGMELVQFVQKVLRNYNYSMVEWISTSNPICRTPSMEELVSMIRGDFRREWWEYSVRCMLKKELLKPLDFKGKRLLLYYSLALDWTQYAIPPMSVFDLVRHHPRKDEYISLFNRTEDFEHPLLEELKIKYSEKFESTKINYTINYRAYNYLIKDIIAHNIPLDEEV